MYCPVNRKELRTLRKMKFWRTHKSNLAKPRLCVYRSNKHIQVQLIDDKTGHVLAAASSFESDLREGALSGKAMAAKIGGVIAERARKTGVLAVVFDRNGFSYHGRIQALADAARSGGLEF